MMNRRQARARMRKEMELFNIAEKSRTIRWLTRVICWVLDAHPYRLSELYVALADHVPPEKAIRALHAGRRRRRARHSLHVEVEEGRLLCVEAALHRVAEPIDEADENPRYRLRPRVQRLLNRRSVASFAPPPLTDYRCASTR